MLLTPILRRALLHAWTFPAPNDPIINSYSAIQIWSLLARRFVALISEISWISSTCAIVKLERQGHCTLTIDTVSIATCARKKIYVCKSIKKNNLLNLFEIYLPSKNQSKFYIDHSLINHEMIVIIISIIHEPFEIKRKLSRWNHYTAIYN